jgi:hypothetical protein
VGERFPPVGPTLNEGNIMKKKIDVRALPELGTSVGLHGSMKQKEVGGPLCFAILAGIYVCL